MAFPDNNTLDLFELTDRTLAVINEKGKVQLKNFDLSFRFSRDSNQLDHQLNFYLYIFGEEFSQTIYSKKYPTTEKIIELLISNLKNEYMYRDVREALILTRIKCLKNKLYETLQSVKSKIVALNRGEVTGVYVDIEDIKSKNNLDKNGMPTFALTAKCSMLKIDISIALAPSVSDWDQKAILDQLDQLL